MEGGSSYPSSVEKDNVDVGMTPDPQPPLAMPVDSEKEGEPPGPSPYDRFPAHRKTLMVAVMAWCGLLSPISSTTVLSAIPEVAATFHTTGTMISLSNALYLVFMAVSTCFWGPLCSVLGRRRSCLTTGIVFLLCSIASALAPNIAAFFIFRMITAIFATAFLVIGPAVIGDLFHPTERATALSWFYTGALVGPCFGPLIGGIIVTYADWRAIFWLQTALAGIGILGPFFLLHETMIANKDSKKVILAGLPTFAEKARYLAKATSPIRPISLLFKSKNLMLIALASGSLVWNQYSLLTPIRYVLNPRFHLSTPLEGGLFYLAPGIGYIIGTLLGGRWSDAIVRRWIARRGGERVAEDRLRSCVVFLGIVLPGCMLIYGWSVDQAVGGIPVPVVFMFAQGVAQSFCFPSLNSYLLDVAQARGKSAEAVAGNFMVRYSFGAVGSAVVLPAVASIGVGWFSTVSAALMLLGGLGVCIAIRHGRGWREKVESRRVAKLELPAVP
ncbi:unnamed protein product [Discula destructiva]